MITYNGEYYSGNKIIRKNCTRAEYNNLTPQNNILYEVTETNGTKKVYLGSNLLEVDVSTVVLPPNEVTLIAKKYRSGIVALKWSDPDNFTYDNTTVTWTKTVVVRKTGSYPVDHSDGTLVVTETTKNYYQDDYFFDSGLTNDTRYYYGIFTQSTAGVWSAGVIFSIVPKNIQPNPVTDFVLTPISKGFKASWAAENIEETDEHFSIDIDHYIVVYKTSGYPSTTTDGTAISTTETSMTINGLTGGTSYYIAIFTVGTNGVISNGVIGTVIPLAYQIMTVRIDTTNSNPETALTYMDDAVGMTPSDDAWDEWFGCYPVILADGGTEYKKLNKNDYTKFEDGTDASSYITNNTSYDVMTAFPCMGVKITTSGNYTYVSMTDNPNAESDGFTYYAHTKGTTKKDKFYLGAYDACAYSSKLYSWSGQTPKVNTYLANARTYAAAKGTGYQLMAFYQWTFLQCLFILKYKNLNCQTALGRGYVDLPYYYSAAAVQTGLTNTKGFNYGLTTSGTDATNNRVKFLGIEDCWGNIYQWLDGCYSDGSYHLLTTQTNDNFNNNGSGYVDCGTMGSISSNYLSKALGTSAGGFAPVTASGSSTTYYADSCRVSSYYCIFVGGSYTSGNAGGLFYFGAYNSASSGSDFLGFRICYL